MASIISITLAVFMNASSVVCAKDMESVDVTPEVIEISEELGDHYCICPELIQAICYVESRFHTDAKNGSCLGIMQVSEKWHKDRMERLGVTDLYDLRGNMTVAVDYLSELSSDGEDLEEALMRYHGETNIKERLESGETSWYVEKVLNLSAELEVAHGK